MVERDFSGNMDVTKERGICKRIESYPSIANNIFRMVELTKEENKEHAMMFSITDDKKAVKSSIVSGSESEIGPEEITEMAEGLSDKMPNRSPISFGQHIVHTHPGGIPDMSIYDMIELINAQKTKAVHESSLIATEHPTGEENKVLLNGLEREQNIGFEARDNMESVANAVKTMTNRGRISIQQGKQRLLKELKPHYQDCSSVLERNSPYDA